MLHYTHRVGRSRYAERIVDLGRDNVHLFSSVEGNLKKYDVVLSFIGRTDGCRPHSCGQIISNYVGLPNASFSGPSGDADV